MSTKKRLWQLISRKVAGEATDDELKELQSLLQDNPDVQYFMDTILQQRKSADKVNEQKAQEAFTKHVQRMQQKQDENERVEHARMLRRNQKTNPLHSFFNSNGVLINYFKIIWRNLFLYKGFSFINISGLAIGMASAILILLWVQNELSYDQFHEKKGRIYQVYNRTMYEGKLECWN